MTRKMQLQKIKQQNIYILTHIYLYSNDVDDFKWILSKYTNPVESEMLFAKIPIHQATFFLQYLYLLNIHEILHWIKVYRGTHIQIYMYNNSFYQFACKHCYSWCAIFHFHPKKNFLFSFAIIFVYKWIKIN